MKETIRLCALLGSIQGRADAIVKCSAEGPSRQNANDIIQYADEAIALAKLITRTSGAVTHE